MSLFENGIDSFGSEMNSIMKNLGTTFNPNSGQSAKPLDPQGKSDTSIPLSRDEMNTFTMLCSLEGRTTEDKMAELIKGYIEEKRNQLKK